LYVAGEQGKYGLDDSLELKRGRALTVKKLRDRNMGLVERK
jgi:hypothetical protein